MNSGFNSFLRLGAVGNGCSLLDARVVAIDVPTVCLDFDRVAVGFLGLWTERLTLAGAHEISRSRDSTRTSLSRRRVKRLSDSFGGRLLDNGLLFNFLGDRLLDNGLFLYNFRRDLDNGPPRRSSVFTNKLVTLRLYLFLRKDWGWISFLDDSRNARGRISFPDDDRSRISFLDDFRNFSRRRCGCLTSRTFITLASLLACLALLPGRACGTFLTGRSFSAWFTCLSVLTVRTVFTIGALSTLFSSYSL